uniref:Uncharacterized protein n=1 Tax=Cyanea leptostegia TaxID=138111 RepID=A0A1Z2QS85_9ASTR|nr:hypothetical protein Cya_lep1Pt0116 [Cyanea leptostegia]ASA34319.1 hypothetical protein Cya_lep1Pt0116 [Cyanea leptostegia]
MNYFENKDVGSKCPCYYCRTYLSANHPKDYYSCSDYKFTKNQCKKGNGINGKRFPELETGNGINGKRFPELETGNGINGKRFPELEKESLFPQIDESLSARKKYKPVLTCPYGKKCHGYKHSYNKGHCDFLEAFQWGSKGGEEWLTEKIPRLSKNRKALEVFQGNIKSLLKEAAQNPKTEVNAWNLGFWHGALLRLQRISPED